MSTSNLVNISGYSDFILAISSESSGLLITGLIFVLFLIVIISLITAGNRNIFEISAISGASCIIPSLLISTLSYQGVSALKIWVVIFFILITAFGVGGMYFSSKN